MYKIQGVNDNGEWDDTLASHPYETYESFLDAWNEIEKLEETSDVIYWRVVPIS